MILGWTFFVSNLNFNIGFSHKLRMSQFCISFFSFALINFFKINNFFHLLPFQLGIVIRALAAGHIPPTNFILVTMGSTSVLLIGWRTLLYSIFPNDQRKKNDVYKRGSPFELFEVLHYNLRMRKIIFTKIKS